MASGDRAFGALLKRYRLAAGLTQEALAERAGLPARAVSDLERDPARLPRLDSVARLADALGLTAEDSGTLHAAALAPTLAHGLPLVIIPLGADMPDNAARCQALGVGHTLPPADCTPEAVRDHVRSILADPAYRANAARVRDTTAALPGIERAVELLARLAAEKRPIVA